jgi:hypothetical protein
VSSYLRIDGDERPLTGARLTWEHAAADGREGVLFHLAAHGGRHLLHLTAWAAGPDIGALSGQVVGLTASGCDAAIDGRMFDAGEVRFGRVTASRAVLSLDGVVEGLDPTVETRATVESDVRCDVVALPERRFCLSCGTPLDQFVTVHDQFVGRHRVRRRSVPVLCDACRGSTEPPRHCPECAARYEAADVHTLADEGNLDWWATCPAGHTGSGTLTATEA